MPGILRFRRDKRLHGLHAIEALVHIHGAEQRLVEAGLVFVGHQQHLVIRRGEPLRQLLLADRLPGHAIRVHARLGVFEPGLRVFDRAAEGDQRADVGVFVLRDVALECLHVAHRVEARRRDDHRLGPPAEMPLHVLAEVLDHHLGLLLDVVRVQAHELGQRPRRLLLRQVRVILDRLHQPVIGRVGGVVLHHVEDETFLDGLPHGVEVKRLRQPVRALAPEQLQRLALRRGGEGEEAQVRLPPARLHDLIQPIFPIRLFLAVLRLGRCAENRLQLARRLAGLAGVRFVHDDRHSGAWRSPPPTPWPARFFLGGRLLLAFRAGGMEQPAQHERKLLQCGDDDLCAVNQRRGQLLRVLVNGLHHALGVLDLVNRILQLPVEHLAVGDDDDAVEDLLRPARRAGWRADARATKCCSSCRCRPSAGSDNCGPALRSRAAATNFRTAVELMVAREDHRLLRHQPMPAAAVVHLLLLLFEEHEVAENVEEAVELQRLPPRSSPCGSRIRAAGCPRRR